MNTALLARRLAIGTIAAWGLLHLVGGMALIVSSTRDSLAQLGSAVESPVADPGGVVGGLIGFHGWNVAAGGLAVLVLAWRATGVSWPRGVGTALLIMSVLDVGLIVFLLAPGYLRWTDGVWGPVLLAVAAVSTAVAATGRSRPGRLGQARDRTLSSPRPAG